MALFMKKDAFFISEKRPIVEDQRVIKANWYLNFSTG
jgi:hypothetical protein